MTVAGKSASEATLKASAVNCAVLPWMKKGFPTLQQEFYERVRRVPEGD